MLFLFLINSMVSSSFSFSSENITRNHFMKGMTCGWAIFSKVARAIEIKTEYKVLLDQSLTNKSCEASL